MCDTNILIDHLLGRSLILKHLLDNNINVTIPLPVWFESIYVLQSNFSQKPTSIVTMLTQILSTQGVTAPASITLLLKLYQQPPLTSIIDCYLIYYARTHHLNLATRDKKLIAKFKKSQIVF